MSENLGFLYSIQMQKDPVTAIVPCPEVDGISCPGIAGKNGKLREISTCHFV
ncbi:hypothetical protein [Proteiniclasticum sp. QWL-01]|uniref:hypothetical protein n=1 Tax=Proteiniclasticum sp. QWL-01 TaxID=3036945 RepID=UPI00241138C2|nr:hypothetical protein [Proteiniclasticum sp. QWL-01]WFF73284.1 hypothetical protein P6M73_02200 [Proteiniclasticum sp. QWL-01]